MPRSILPLVVLGDLAVVAVLYAVLDWPALFFAVPLMIGSIVVVVVLRATAPLRRIAAPAPQVPGDPRVPAGPGVRTGWVPGAPLDDDETARSWRTGPSSSWDSSTGDSSAGPGSSPSWDSGTSSDSSCSWSDSGSSSSSDSSCSSSDSGSSSSSSD